MDKPLLIIAIIFIVFSCKKKEEYNIRLKVAKPFSEEAGLTFGAENAIPIEGAEIVVYRQEIDYVLDKNAAFSGVSDINGDISFKDNAEFNYFFRVKKDSLNEQRFAKDYLNRFGSGRNKKIYTKEYFLPLSTTPAKLQINVFNNGLPVKDAEVQIYFTEQDYLNNKPPVKMNDFSKEYSNPSYGILFENRFFYKLTDINGLAYFDNLEPREYWFKVKWGEKNNASTVFKTGEKLNNNPDITKVLPVILN